MKPIQPDTRLPPPLPPRFPLGRGLRSVFAFAIDRNGPRAWRGYNRRGIAVALLGAALVAACAPSRPPPAPEIVVPWGAVEYEKSPPYVVMPTGHQSTLSVSKKLGRELRKNKDGIYEYPGITISGGGSHGAWGAGFLKGMAEAGTRPEFRIVTAMSVGALLATSAFLGPDYDDLMTQVFVDSDQDDLYQVGFGTILGGLFGRGHFANVTRGEKLLGSIYGDDVIDAVAREYIDGRRLYILTANFDDDQPTLWDMGAIAASSEPDRYDRYRKIIQAAIAVPAAFPPVYFPVEVDGQTYGQMHLDAGTSFVFLLDFMVGGDAKLLAEAELLSQVQGVLYVLMNTQRKAGFTEPPSGAPLTLARRAYQRIGRYASYGALDRLWIYGTERNTRFKIAKIPEDLEIPFDVFEFPQPGMADLFAQGRAAAKGYAFSDRPPGLPVPVGTAQERALKTASN